jgi:hypothetical protein
MCRRHPRSRCRPPQRCHPPPPLPRKPQRRLRRCSSSPAPAPVRPCARNPSTGTARGAGGGQTLDDARRRGQPNMGTARGSSGGPARGSPRLPPCPLPPLPPSISTVTCGSLGGRAAAGHHTGLAVDAGEKTAEMETGVHKVLDPLVAGHGGRGGRDIWSPARLRVFPRHHLVAGAAPRV